MWSILWYLSEYKYYSNYKCVQFKRKLRGTRNENGNESGWNLSRNSEMKDEVNQIKKLPVYK